MQPGDWPGDEQPNEDTASAHHDELPARLPEGEAAADDRRDGEAVEDEASGVVDHALALHDGDDAPGDAQPLHDRTGGDGIGRRDQRPQDERHRPSHPENRMRCDRDECGAGQDEADGEEQDRAQIGAEVAPRRKPC